MIFVPENKMKNHERHIVFSGFVGVDEAGFSITITVYQRGVSKGRVHSGSKGERSLVFVTYSLVKWTDYTMSRS